MTKLYKVFIINGFMFSLFAFGFVQCSEEYTPAKVEAFPIEAVVDPSNTYDALLRNIVEEIKNNKEYNVNDIEDMFREMKNAIYKANLLQNDTFCLSWPSLSNRKICGAIFDALRILNVEHHSRFVNELYDQYKQMPSHPIRYAAFASMGSMSTIDDADDDQSVEND